MNRKQRRAKDATSTSTGKIQSVDDVPMVRPDYDAPRPTTTKTLYEIAAERRAALMPDQYAPTSASSQQSLPPDAKNVVNVKIGPDGTIQPLNSIQSDEVVNDHPLLDTLLLASSLSALHFTLEALTTHQYAEALEFRPIAARTLFVAFPTLCLLIHLLHGHLIPSRLRQRKGVRLEGTDRGGDGDGDVVHAAQALFYLILANVAGCYLIYITNDRGYMAVMKNAPSVGTLWVWAILELGLVGALLGVLGPAAYAWYYGYGIF